MTVARATVDLNWAGSPGAPGANVWHLRVDAAITDSVQIAGLLEDLHTFYTSIAGLLATGVTASFDGEIQGVGVDAETFGTYPAWSVAGSGNGGYAPAGTALLVNWRASSGGRSGRGRTFIGPLAASVLDTNGTPFNGGVTTLQDAADALIGESEDPGNGAWGIWSRADQVVRDFSSAAVPDKYALLRSRRD